MTEREHTAVAIDELLAHQGWVRSLAASLVHDEASAEDVAQETWLTALENPPPRRAGLASWLARVVRSRAFDLFRAESRRATRERRAARREAVAAAPDAAAEAETCRRLAEAVCALPAAAREAVVLHYYRGLTCREVAARISVPIETVRTRIRRALEDLRVALGAKDRERFRSALLPLALFPARRPPLAALLGGGLLMATKLKVAGVVVLLALLAAGTWRLATPARGPATGPPPRENGAMPALRSEAPAPDGEAGPPPRPAPSPAAAPSPESVGPPGTLLGRVRLSDGGSAAGTVVALSWVGQRGEERRNRRVEVEPDGTFRFDGIEEAGMCFLRVMKPGYGAETLDVSCDGAGRSPLEILLHPAGTLVVRVVGRQGEPARDIFLEVRGPQPALLEAATTDVNGVARLEGLAPGTWTVGARGKAGGAVTVGGPPRPGDRKVEVASGETAEITVNLSSATAVGTARLPDGRPVANGFVYLRRLHPDFQNFSLRTDADGRFTLDTPAEGEFEVSIQSLGTPRFIAPAGKAVLTPGETTELNLRIAETSIAGRLRRAGSAEPVAKANVQANPVVLDADGRPAGTAEGGAGGSTWPAEDGTFTFIGLAPGTYEIRVYPHDRRLGSETRVVELPEAGRLDGIDFAFREKPVGTLRLRVLDENGDGCERIQIGVRRGATGGTFPGTSLGGGLFEVLLDPGKQVVEVQVSGYEYESFTVEIAEAEILDREVRLTPFRR